MYDNSHVIIGSIGEAVAIAKFTQAGFKVSIPFTYNLPYDLIVDYNGHLYKIQIKTTEKINNNKMVFNGTRNNGKTVIKFNYGSEEIDYFFLYCIENNWCGLIKQSLFQTKEARIHLELPKNSNYAKCKMAYDYEFSHRIDEIRMGIEIPLLPKPKNENTQSKVITIVDTINNITNREKLKDEIRRYPFTTIGKMYKVSDNTIRKWCIKMGLPYSSRKIKQYTEEEWKNI